MHAAVMKDVPQYPLEMLKQRSEESARMQLFPNLDYNGLFNVVVQLIDVTPSVQLGIQCKCFNYKNLTVLFPMYG